MRTRRARQEGIFTSYNSRFLSPLYQFARELFYSSLFFAFSFLVWEVYFFGELDQFLSQCLFLETEESPLLQINLYNSFL